MVLLRRQYSVRPVLQERSGSDKTETQKLTKSTTPVMVQLGFICQRTGASALCPQGRMRPLEAAMVRNVFVEEKGLGLVLGERVRFGWQVVVQRMWVGGPCRELGPGVEGG